MAQKVYSFAVSPDDTATLKIVEDLRADCKATGRTFTWVILQALKDYDAKLKGARNVKNGK